ncbi:uncharacterized protein LOC110679094 [Aedes aegypti]|uniref:Uncharacterized protein n=1 Tax=Aedes aegypti TaxID=7159 RepID=A0A6I8U9K7_AEDAE|nr:uncharacterized protein LOC110679094 [Aedes aegypti]
MNCKCWVKPEVDTQAPILFVDNILHSTKLVHDVQRQREIARENKQLLKRINKINRTEGFLGVKYDYKPKANLNFEARRATARTIQHENFELLERILNVSPEINAAAQEKSYRNLIKYRNICAKFANNNQTKQSIPNSSECPCIIMKIYERIDRKLGVIKINTMQDTIIDRLRTSQVNCINGSIYRIYQDQYIVIRGHFDAPDSDRGVRKQLLKHVPRGSLLRAAINDHPAYMITLKDFDQLANCELLGTVTAGSRNVLDLVNYYGTTYGRMREPLNFRCKLQG